MKRAHQVTAVVCLVFAAFVMRQSLAMRLHTPLGPGPGFFPFWLAVIFGGLATVMLVQATLQRSAAGPADLVPTAAGYWHIAAILGALVGAVILMNPLGFRLTSLGFYLFLLTTLSRPQLGGGSAGRRRGQLRRVSRVRELPPDHAPCRAPRDLAASVGSVRDKGGEPPVPDGRVRGRAPAGEPPLRAHRQRHRHAVGVLPGIGPIAGIAILIPLTFKLDATGAIIMLAAIYYGAMYGGTITHPDQRPRRGGLRGHLHRRLRDGQAGPGRRGAGHRRDRLVHRRHRRHPRAGRCWRRRSPGSRSRSGRRSSSR